MRLPLLLGPLLAGCAAPGTPAPPPTDLPYALVLGSAQDGGFPQIGCQSEACRAARRDPRRRRLVTSLLLVDPRAGARYLLDASLDLPEQVALCDTVPPNRRRSGPRPPLFEAIFLTHAHIGHYGGLLYLGREIYGVRGQPVFASERMGRFLRENAPWSQLVDSGALVLRTLHPGRSVVLADDLEVTPILVPHRDELSDTLAFLVRGPNRSLLYLPDIDKWELWERSIEGVLAGVDVALLDGTFFGPDELPDRDMSAIPHPFIVESLARLRTLPREERSKILFTHLNHSNPAADPGTPQAARIRASGMGVARRGLVIGL